MNNNNNNNNSAPRTPSKQDVMNENLDRDFKNQRPNSNVVGRGNDYRDHRRPYRKGVMGWLQRKCAPLVTRWSRVKFRLEESSKKRKKIILSCLAILIVGSCYWGLHDKIGAQVANSAVESQRTFVNDDNIKLTNEKYDRHNQTMRLNFVTRSDSGAVSPQNLSARFVIKQGPKSNDAIQPSLTLIPTFNNHFIITIHHLYKDFGGIKITFHNSSHMTLGTVNQAIQNDYGGPLSNLSEKKKNKIEAIAGQGASNGSSGSYAIKLTKKLERKDDAAFIIGEVYAKQHAQGHIDPKLSGYQLAMQELQTHLKRDYGGVQSNKALISREKDQIKDAQNKLREINRNADTTSKDSEVGGVRQNVQSANNDIRNYKSKIGNLQKDIQLTQSRITKLKNNISILPKAKTPAKGEVFNDSKS